MRETNNTHDTKKYLRRLLRAAQERFEPIDHIEFIVVTVAEIGPGHILGNFHRAGADAKVAAAPRKLPEPPHHLLGQRLNDPRSLGALC